MRRASLAVLVLAAGCASVPINKKTAADLTQADALVLQGCYDCLTDARAIYERAAVGKARPLVVPRLFETTLLIVLRDKELAIDPSASMMRARALAAELPPQVEATRYLGLVDLVPSDEAGIPRRDQLAFRQAHEQQIRNVDAELAWLETGSLQLPFRQYLRMAVNCGYPARPRPPQAPTSAPTAVAEQMIPDGQTPLLEYRIGICRAGGVNSVTRVRTAVPRFYETSLFLGRGWMDTVKADGGVKPREFLTEAYAHFPQSPSVTYAMGQYHQLAGGCATALKYYDETIAAHPLHENALLGRTMCLVFTKRMDEAIREATHMIDVGTDNVVHAFYWRAFVYHYQKQLAEARADIEQAKKRSREASVFTLAGIIEHDQDDLPQAYKDLVTAHNAPDLGLDCTPSWYLGAVTLKQEKFLESADHFNEAMDCYHARVNDEERSRALIVSKTDLDPDFRAAQIASYDAAIKEDRGQQYASAFNAACRYVQALKNDKALPLLDIAANEPSYADRIAELRKYIKGGGASLRVSSVEYGDVHPGPFRHDARHVHD